MTRRLLSYIFFGFVAFGLLTYGAVNPLAGSIFTLLLGVIAIFALATQGEPKATAPVCRAAIVLVFVLAGWVIIQTLPLDKLANPAWQDLGAFVSAHPKTISVAPADSLAALPNLIAPFVVFITALVLFPSDEEAQHLLSFIALFGGALAIWAICELTFSPHTLLLEEKRSYLDSLTAPFANRNTAGTFYGLVSMISFVGIYIEARVIDFRSLMSGKRLSDQQKRSIWRIVLMFACFSGSAAALLLTKSRGGVGCTFIAYLFLVPLVLWAKTEGRNGRGAFSSSRRGLAWRVGKVVGGLAGVILVGAVFADRALFRAEVQGLDDGRFCVAPAILQSAKDNQLTGVGFATFRLFFPAYRDALCGVAGVWDRAHSVYLEAYLGLGWIFFALLLVGVGVLVWTLVRGIGTRRSLRAYPILGLAILVLVLAHSSIDFSVQIPGFATVFAAGLAAVVTISRGRSSSSGRAQNRN